MTMVLGHDAAPDAAAGRDAVTWDAHAHVIGDTDRYPLAAGRGYTPPPAPLESYLAMLDALGVARGVLVQPSVYGHDHGCLLDALDRAGGRLLGIAVPAPSAAAVDLEALHRRGIRGVRCNLINPGGLAIEVVKGWGSALRALGWHVELHVPIGDVAACVDALAALEVPVVIDHMGRPTPGGTDPSAPGPAALIALVRGARCFVKLSAPYRLSRQEPPWTDVAPLAHALVDANPRACLWGSDWPHTDIAASVRASDLLAAFSTWCPDAATLRIVTAHAATRLFATP